MFFDPNLKIDTPAISKIFLAGFIIFGLSLFVTSSAWAGASLYLSPSTGTFTKESTFDVSIFLNTGGQSANAFELTLNFPATKLQVVSPQAGSSVVSIWITQPTFSNSNGTVTLAGGLPSPGINSSGALITTITFRAKGTGPATLSLGDNSKVLANDGAGTNILTSKTQATYTLTLPPPSGPVVTSTTHPDTNVWYNYSAATFKWEPPSSDIVGYSFILDQNPSTIPDKAVNTKITSQSFESLPDGRNYFHLRAQNTDGWGSPTHFLVKIDKTPPAKFTPSLDRIRTTPELGGLLSFSTTDQASGISRYEVRIIDQSKKDQAGLFTEQKSPYKLPQLETGDYQVVVRAYDGAGNMTDGTVTLNVALALNPWDYVINALNLAPASLAPARTIVLLLLAASSGLAIYLWKKRRSSPLYHADRDIRKIEEDLAALTNEEQEVSDLKRKIEVNLKEMESQAQRGKVSPEKHGLLHTISAHLKLRKVKPKR